MLGLNVPSKKNFSTDYNPLRINLSGVNENSPANSEFKTDKEKKPISILK